MKIYKVPKYPYVTAVEIPKERIELIDFALCAQPTRTLKEYYDACEVKPAIVCNGGFFNFEGGKTIFNYMDNGEIISQTPYAQEGMGTINGELTFGSLGQGRFTDFVSGYPVLIKDRKIFKTSIAQEINYKARRTILAYNHSHVYVFGVEAPGMDFNDMYSMLQGYCVDYAINLDGGGSTKILHNGNSLTSSWYNRSVDNVVAFYLKARILYRVQAGAYKNKTNAENAAAQIRRLPDKIRAGYSGAYVRETGGYYKVQIGLFAVKANAVRVLNDLKGMGYDSFITTI